MSRLLVKGGRVVDPSQGIDRALDVLLEDGKVAKLAARIPARGAQVIEADGLVVCPGFIDIHTHLRSWRRPAPRAACASTR
jgi:dihydroorotase